MRLRALIPLALSSALAACHLATSVGPPPWRSWEGADRYAVGRASIDSAEQVTENRHQWRGPSDLSAEVLMTHDGRRMTVLADIIDDRPLQQSRRERVHPGWWLMRVGGDAVGVTLGETHEVVAALGSAGIAPEIILGEPADSVEVWPTPTGARVRLVIDLAARDWAGQVTPRTEVTITDVDGPADWSVHRAVLR